MNYNNIFLNALLGSQETKGNSRWWRRGKKRGGVLERGKGGREVGEGRRRVKEMEV